MIDPKEWISAKRAAAMADLTVQWVRVLGQKGELRTVQTDLGTLYNLEDVRRKAEERAEKGKAAGRSSAQAA